MKDKTNLYGGAGGSGTKPSGAFGGDGNKIRSMKDNTTVREKKIKLMSRPRSFGKSTMVTDAFLVSAKAGQKVEFQHPDYVCLSRLALEALIQSEKKAYLEELVGEDQNLYEKERKLGKFDWRVERETGANEEKMRLRQLNEEGKNA